MAALPVTLLSKRESDSLRAVLEPPDLDPIADRRGPQRLRCELPVRLRVEGGGPGELVLLRDVSRHGAYVELLRVPRVLPGARVALGFVTAAFALALARGRVLRVADTGFAMSIHELNGGFADLVAAPQSWRELDSPTATAPRPACAHGLG